MGRLYSDFWAVFGPSEDLLSVPWLSSEPRAEPVLEECRTAAVLRRRRFALSAAARRFSRSDALVDMAGLPPFPIAFS